VLGNHDYFYNRKDAVISELQRAGWTVLLNQNLPLPGTGN